MRVLHLVHNKDLKLITLMNTVSEILMETSLIIIKKMENNLITT